MNLEISKMLTLSTAHITQEDSERLDNKYWKDNFLIANFDYGHIIMLPTVDHLDHGLSPAFVRCIEFAREQNCDWIRFDRDGPKIDELPVFEW